LYTIYSSRQVVYFSIAVSKTFRHFFGHNDNEKEEKIKKEIKTALENHQRTLSIIFLSFFPSLRFHNAFFVTFLALKNNP
jgi:pyruvate kinase